MGQHAGVGDHRPACRRPARAPASPTGRARVLFHVGSSWRGQRTAGRRTGARSAIVAGSTSTASGSLWPHHTAIDGWWPSRSTASRAWRTACLRTAAGVAPLQREVLPEQHAGLVGGVVQLGPADVARGRAAGRGRRRGRARRRARSSSASASASAMPVGPWLAPFRNSRSPLTVQRPSRASRPARSPVRTRARRSLVPPSSTVDLDVDVVRAAGRRAACGHHSCGLGDGDASTRPGSRPRRAAAASLLERLADASGAHASTGARPRSLSSTARSATMARSVVGLAAQHPQVADAHRPGLLDAHRPPDAAGVPVGSRQSQCWNTPVMLRLAVRSCGGRRPPRRRARARAGRGQRSVISKAWGKK